MKILKKNFPLVLLPLALAVGTSAITSRLLAADKAGVSQLAWVKSVEEASVPETTAVQETMRNMINLDKAAIVFPTSFGYFDPHILKVAKQYPKVQFLH